ncbi:hypothetical protein MSG28_000515 [Choristoneura fumiferana]|uniref:Uncharacterized protein n=1 Tax=Choristoneura fumiferana TaxID=7141 RepID=A0ACC0K138_CHOFU|nr:hypothetical protein MSG28_000515 [Choristoneura fumiferana]
MVLLRLLVMTTSLFISQGYSQLTLAPRPCGPASIIPIGQCIVPAVIKPLITPCQPLFSSQPLLPCPPLPPMQPLLPLQPLQPCPPTPPPPTPPCISKKTAPSEDDDDDEDLDKILYLLINNILENRKNSGKKPSSSKGTDSDNGIDPFNNNVDFGDDYESILPSPYLAPSSATFYPYGVGAQATASSSADASFSLQQSASENDYAPEIYLTFKPFLGSCL